MFEDVTEAAIDQANQLLAFLTDRANANYQKVLTEALDEAELELNLKNLDAALKRTKLDAPVGALLGGTGMAKAEAGLTGEDSQRAVRLLKQNDRLIQAGKGRGKALIVLNAKPLSKDDFVAEVAKPKAVKKEAVHAPDAPGVIGATDVPNLLRAANNEYKSLLQRHAELSKVYDETKIKLAEATTRTEALVKENEELMAELEKKQNLAAVTTWQ